MILLASLNYTDIYHHKENTQPEQPKEEQKPKFVEKMKQVKEPDADEKRWKE
jgi:hypothetical protein